MGLRFQNKVNRIGSGMGLVSTVIGLIVAFFMMDLQSNQLEFISQPSIIISALSALLISHFLGIKGAIKIITGNKNFILIWSMCGLATVILSELIGFFIHITLVDPYMNHDHLLFFFFIVAFYAFFLVIIIGSILGFVVKSLGDNLKLK